MHNTEKTTRLSRLTGKLYDIKFVFSTPTTGKGLSCRYLTPLSTIFQLYCSGQQTDYIEETNSLSRITGNLSCF